MKPPKLAITAALLLVAASPVFAHRTDEYLQATTIALGKDRVHVEIRLIPGEAVFSIVLAAIDTDANGVISAGEQRAYAERVVRDLSLTIDDDRVMLWPASWTFPAVEEMKEGRGVIRLEVDGGIVTRGQQRGLVFENHHLPLIAAYLVNGLVPSDPDVRLGAQTRDYTQSVYRLEYVQAGVASSSESLGWSSAYLRWIAAALLLIAVRRFVRRQRRTASSLRAA